MGMTQSTGVLAWHGIHDDLLSSVQRMSCHNHFSLIWGFSPNGDRLETMAKKGSDVNDARGAYLRKIGTVDRVKW
jgi:hypothetical protein